MIRKVLFQGLKIVISGMLIGYLLHRIGIRNVVEYLNSANGYWLAGAFILYAISLLLGSVQWWLLLCGEGIEISWRKTVSFYFVGLFFNNFLISGLGGDFFRMVDIKRYSKNGTGAVSSVFLDRFVGLFVLSGMTVFAIPWILIQGERLSQLWIPLCFIIGGWIFILFFLFRNSLAQFLSRIIRKAIPKKINAKVEGVYQKITQFRHRRNLLLRVVGLSIAIQSFRVMTHYFLGRSVGITSSPIYYFLLIPVIAVVASLPISVGGLGLREQSGVVLFGVLGVQPIQAFTMEALAYLVAVFLSLPGGIVFVVRKKIESVENKILEKRMDIGVES